MSRSIKFVLGSLLILLATASCVGCSNSPGESPTSPQLQTGNSAQSEPAALIDGQDANHYLWGYYLLHVDPVGPTIEITQVRYAATHMNILQFLEQAPCSNCLKIAGIQPGPNGTLLVDISIKHPFKNLNLTGFDVRGIAMFTGSHQFPASGLTSSDHNLGDGELLNADGLTSLYNPSTIGHGMEGYIKGKLSTKTVPNATLNGFKRFITNKPENVRNAFYAGDTIVVSYQIKMPAGPFVFGYAVDASWAPAIHKPVENPMTDFGLDANCPEAWQISVSDTPISAGLTDCGGSTKLSIDVFDWQGKDDAHPVLVECPELFDGTVPAQWTSDGTGFSTYEATVENLKTAPIGSYLCLISKEAAENDPSKPWLNLTAFQVHPLEVTTKVDFPPTALASAGQSGADVDDPVSFDATASHDNDCNGQLIVKYEWDWNGDGNFVEEPAQTSHSWSTPGTYQVQLRVTDDEGSTDVLDQPVQIEIQTPQDPVAKAYADPLHQVVGKPVHFYDQGSYDQDEGGESIVKYEWDWDNDGIYDAEGAMVDHVWDAPGVYHVQFRVTDDEGATATLKNPLEIDIDQDGIPENPVDVTPPWLNFCPRDTVVDGNLALVQSYYACHIFDISDHTHPVWKSIIDRSQYGELLKAVGQYGYFGGVNDNTLYIMDISSPSSPVLAGSVSMDVPYFSAFTVADGYGYFTNSKGFHIVDVDPPDQAHLVKSLDFPYSEYCQSIMVSGGYAWAPLAVHGLRVFDVSPPEDTAEIGSITIPGNLDGFQMSGDYIYVLTTKTPSDPIDAIRIVKTTPPEAPSLVSTVALQNFPPPYPYSWKFKVDGSFVYVTAHDRGLQIIDATQPESAFLAKVVDNAGGNYLDAGGGYAYVATENSDLLIVDVDPPEAASLVKNVTVNGAAYEVSIAGDCAIVSDFYDGLVAVDISSPPDAYIAGLANTPGYARRLAVSNGFLYVADWVGGLQIIDITVPEAAHVVNSLDIGRVQGIKVAGGYAYAATSEGLLIVDVSSPEAAFVVKTVADAGDISGVDVQGEYAYVTGNSPSYTGLSIVDIDPPEDAKIVKFNDWIFGWDIVVSGGYAFSNGSQLFVTDIDPVESMEVFTTLNCSGPSGLASVAESNGYLFCTCENQIGIADIDPMQKWPPQNSVWGIGNGLSGIDVLGGYAYISTSESYVILDIDPIDDPSIFQDIHLEGYSDWGSVGRDICVSDGYAYYAYEHLGVRIFKLW